MRASPSLQWSTEALQRQLAPLLPGLSIEVVASASSTSTVLLDRVKWLGQGSHIDDSSVLIRRSVESAAFGRRAADMQPTLLVAEHQTGGRGRQGRGWQSAAGASLTFSLGLPLAPADWSGLSLAVGVALAESIVDRPASGSLDEPVASSTIRPQQHRPARVGLKWPNDLWLMDDGRRTGRKLGGVLIETVAAGAQRLVVIGVGLNVLPFPTESLASGFASVQELDPGVTAPRLLGRIALPLVQAVRRFEVEGFVAFLERFAALDVLRGQPLRSAQGVGLSGTGAGVTADGALLLQTDDGLLRIASGEVSVRIETSAVPEAPC